MSSRKLLLGIARSQDERIKLVSMEAGCRKCGRSPRHEIEKSVSPFLKRDTWDDGIPGNENRVRRFALSH